MFSQKTNSLVCFKSSSSSRAFRILLLHSGVWGMPVFLCMVATHPFQPLVAPCCLFGFSQTCVSQWKKNCVQTKPRIGFDILLCARALRLCFEQGSMYCPSQRPCHSPPIQFIPFLINSVPQKSRSTP